MSRCPRYALVPGAGLWDTRGHPHPRGRRWLSGPAVLSRACWDRECFYPQTGSAGTMETQPSSTPSPSTCRRLDKPGEAHGPAHLDGPHPLPIPPAPGVGSSTGQDTGSTFPQTPLPMAPTPGGDGDPNRCPCRHLGNQTRCGRATRRSHYPHRCKRALAVVENQAPVAKHHPAARPQAQMLFPALALGMGLAEPLVGRGSGAQRVRAAGAVAAAQSANGDQAAGPGALTA